MNATTTDTKLSDTTAALLRVIGAMRRLTGKRDTHTAARLLHDVTADAEFLLNLKMTTAIERAEHQPIPHQAIPDDLPEPGDRCRTCGLAVTWIGPDHLDWEHVHH